jgi:hypothetical protein
MKKLTILLTLTVLLGSCTSTTVFDKTVPPEQSAKVTFLYYYPASYNGIPVKSNKMQVSIITFPAGRATFNGDMANGLREVYTKGNIANFSCVLEAGKEYVAVADYIGAEIPNYRIWGIYLFHDERKTENLIGFIPFDPSITSTGFVTSLYGL